MIKLVINSLIFVIIDIVRLFLLITVISFALSSNEKPNIVLILIDDLGLTDIGAFGSEIDTPNMDMLAGEGLIFSNYHTSPECAPSRAMLLTGMDNHNIGIPMIPEVMPRNLRSIPGYEGYLIPEALTLAELLRPHGYKTYMTGKWHLGFGEKKLQPCHTTVALKRHLSLMQLVETTIPITLTCPIMQKLPGSRMVSQQHCLKTFTHRGFLLMK